MPTFIYKLQLLETFKHPENHTDDFNNTILAHFEYLKFHFERGIIKVVGRTTLPFDDPNLFGLCIFDADDENNAITFMHNDPVIVKGIMSGEVLPFNLIFI
ncbi:MAG: hypothetical protein KA974_06430 [Saprospiraceae bacterium]|nr:hypothetical protein [Saprospiraceae bacterium]